jgi:hypothetical protein
MISKMNSIEDMYITTSIKIISYENFEKNKNRRT